MREVERDAEVEHALFDAAQPSIHISRGGSNHLDVVHVGPDHRTPKSDDWCRVALAHGVAGDSASRERNLVRDGLAREEEGPSPTHVDPTERKEEAPVGSRSNPPACVVVVDVVDLEAVIDELVEPERYVDAKPRGEGAKR